MLRLFNTAGRRLAPLRPAAGKPVGMFTCGPSVYQRAHIGNFRTFLFEDTLVRYLQYSGHRVKRGMTVTDIEDKAIAEAAKEGTSLKKLTDRNIDVFIADMKLLRMRVPDYMPRASECVDESVAIIKRLIELGIAYLHKDNVYFDPLRFSGFGKLYGLDMSKWPAEKKRFHRDTYPGMRWNLGDFILWHGYRKGDIVFWDTDIGRGRPSWNVQDPSMITRYFNEPLSIYCGGIDNLIRHHDYSKAILESIRPYPMARFWLHCQHLLVRGRKMSKSRGNIYYTDTLLDKGYSPAEIRFFLIYGHYRDSLDYSDKTIEESSQKLRGLKRSVGRIMKAAHPNRPAVEPSEAVTGAFRKDMVQDLNVRGAIDAVDAVLSGIRTDRLDAGEASSIIQALKEIDSVLRVIF